MNSLDIKVVGKPKWFVKKLHQFLHVWMLREYLNLDLRSTNVPKKVEYDIKRLIDDFIFICSFSGNDSLPYMPTLEIHEGGNDLLIHVYKQEFKNLRGYLVNMEKVELGTPRWRKRYYKYKFSAETKANMENTRKEIATAYAIAVSKEIATAFPDRTFISLVVDLLTKNGRNGSKPKPDNMVLPVIEESRRVANLMPQGKTIAMTDEEIVEMVLFPVVNEACRVLKEKFVLKASDLAIASVLGMSFPSYSDGIVFWADVVGSKHIYTSLKKWSEKYGNFYKSSRFLEERAMNGVPLKKRYYVWGIRVGFNYVALNQGDKGKLGVTTNLERRGVGNVDMMELRRLKMVMVAAGGNGCKWPEDAAVMYRGGMKRVAIKKRRVFLL
ncbi:unnamed protein product [Lactuca saligna]|uniref:Xrn1 helical domain-containing protein n=1 Tax=Lactuca saligna TaxID=75948 RepID=A0AA35ZKB1_LACSI|nr:unnamed protein product [Lactuca saligna]